MEIGRGMRHDFSMQAEPFEIDPQVEAAVCMFIEHAATHLPVSSARLFGNRARGNCVRASDADLAVFMKVERKQKFNLFSAKAIMAEIAFDVPSETHVLVSTRSIWDEEWAHPERYLNPRLLENIRREGPHSGTRVF